MKTRGLSTSRLFNQNGFSIIELLVALMVAVLIMGVSVMALTVTSRADKQGAENLTSSNSAFATGSRFADDVASVGPVSGVSDLVSAGQMGCGDSTSVLRLIGPRPNGTGVQVRSFHVVNDSGGSVLKRRVCSGSDLSAALVATPSRDATVVGDVAAGSGTVAVTCDGSATFASSCRVIEMTIQTVSGRSFTVRGTVGSILAPTATTSPAPVIAPVSGSCTILASETTWGATGGDAGSSGSNHAGETVMKTYYDGNRRNSFIKVDLTQPCLPGGDWPTLPGGRTLTGATLFIAYVGKVDGGCCGISYDGQQLQPLNAASVWSEASLTGSTMPSGVYSGFTYNFSSSSSGSLTGHSSTTILDAVKNWYMPSTAPGSWPNNGWILSRSAIGDTLGKSNAFASRSHGTAGLRPRLTVTWGP